MEKKWNFKQYENEAAEKIHKNCGISRIAANILVTRGITEIEDAERYLHPAVEALHNPMKMHNMQAAIERLHQAVMSNEKIVIFGDYDTDGISATALLLRFFKLIGQRVDYYIPSRVTEGYGMQKQAIRTIAEGGASLIITVDCGIGNTEEVKLAHELSMDVIITDHHEIPDAVPEKAIILNPKMPDCPYPFKDLSGVGVAYKLTRALAQYLSGGEELEPRFRNYFRDVMGLVALGTVADVVPLVDENRILTSFGINSLMASKNVGFHALLQECNLRDRDISSIDIAFRMSPRLNASGRVEHAGIGVDLLTTTSFTEAIQYAEELSEHNRRRQEYERVILEKVRAEVENDADLKSKRTIVLSGKDWHSGVIGIVASRLVEEYFRPTVLIAEDDGIGRGSARSIPGFHLFKVLGACNNLLLEYGGHASAAGLSIKSSNIDAFRKEFEAQARLLLTEEDMIPSLTIDVEIDVDEITEDLIDELKAFEPFGHMNPAPIFAVRNVNVAGKPYPCGKLGQHISFVVARDGVSKRAIAYGKREKFESILANSSRIDVAFTPYLNTWQGRKQAEMRVIDVRPSEL